MIRLFYTPRKQSLRVCPSFCPLSVDMILSTHVTVLRNGCMDFSENLYTHYSSSEDVHILMDNLSSFYRFFLFSDLVIFL